MKKIFAWLTLGAVSVLAVSCCGQKWSETENDSIRIVSQKRGATLGYSANSGVALLFDKGYAFKDLNRNGVLDVYEDWRKPALERAQDLAAQLSIEEIAGLMLYSAHQAIPSEEISQAQYKFLTEDHVRHVLMTKVASPEVAAKWNNNVQALTESIGHGIPANNSSDPRHGSLADAEYNEGSGGQISLWPGSLGIAATFRPEVMERFGEIASIEYRALGIATALSPQVDLATEPRWSRVNGTFGEDVNLVTDMSRAYVDGFQNTSGAKNGWGEHSVNAMVKHWPGGGAGEGGRDAHFGYGKYAVYPGNNIENQKIPFAKGAFKLKGKTQMASAVMPYYTISTDQNPEGENVGNSYSHYIITDQLRGVQGYEGVVCTDWMITSDEISVELFTGKCWGVEGLSVGERHYKVLMAGVDQFGGNNDKGPVLEAYAMGVEEHGEEYMRARFEQSAVRLLMNVFRTGLFENPYLDPAQTAAIVGCPEFMAEAYQVQLESIVMLKNVDNTLPMSSEKKVYIPQKYIPSTLDWWGRWSEARWEDAVNKELVAKYYTLVDTPQEADFAICFMDSPKTGAGYDKTDRDNGGNGYMPISLQYNDYTATTAREVSLAGGDPYEDFTTRSYRGKTVKTLNQQDMLSVLETKAAMGDKPVIVSLNMNNPTVMAEFEGCADAILVNFGVQNQAVLDIVSGVAEPSALLPLQMPANMETVEAQFEDVPRDMECYVDSQGNTYDFAFGLNWSGVINDYRVQKYK